MVALWNRADHYIFMLWFVMVALCNRADHYIFMLWFVMAALCNRGGPLYFCPVISIFLWPPYEIGGHYIFACGYYLSFLLSFYLFFLA